ncbi:MAG: hypothetical protein IKV15_02600 [Bacteroidaceae bacterium]|nr:hypothetical protein [Bacteroidaceae bacterium]
MITKEQMQAFFEQQIAEKGKKQLTIEAMQWAIDNGIVSVLRMKSLPLEQQQREIIKLMKMYTRSLM